MVALWIVIFIQFACIGWLVYDKVKPKEIDPWERAKQMLDGWGKSEEEKWELEFSGKKPLKSFQPTDHVIVSAERGVYNGMDKIHWTCACGFDARNATPSLMNITFEKHVRDEKELAKYMKK